MKEDYVSYKVAKLLKDKGFNDPFTHMFINKDNVKFDCSSSGVVPKETIACPTHQMAMKWLREVHGLHITILWDCGACIGKNSFCYHIDRIDNYEDKGYNKIGFDSNEEAVEAALKYSLENLI